jgi:hypothetical protein
MLAKSLLEIVGSQIQGKFNALDIVDEPGGSMADIIQFAYQFAKGNESS